MIYLVTAWKGDFPGDQWQQLADVVLPVFREYAARHGYGFECHEGEYGTHPNYLFQRMEYMQDRLLNLANLDYLWMLDLDVLITNHAIPVEWFLDQSHDLFIAKDINGINGGSLVLRNSPLARDWCEQLIALSKTAEGENHAMILLDEQERFHSATEFVPALNSMPYEEYPTYGRKNHSSQWEPGRFVCHLPGKPPMDCIQLFSKIKIIQ